MGEKPESDALFRCALSLPSLPSRYVSKTLSFWLLTKGLRVRVSYLWYELPSVRGLLFWRHCGASRTASVSEIGIVLAKLRYGVIERSGGPKNACEAHVKWLCVEITRPYNMWSIILELRLPEETGYLRGRNQRAFVPIYGGLIASGFVREVELSKLGLPLDRSFPTSHMTPKRRSSSFLCYSTNSFSAPPPLQLHHPVRLTTPVVVHCYASCRLVLCTQPAFDPQTFPNL